MSVYIYIWICIDNVCKTFIDIKDAEKTVLDRSVPKHYYHLINIDLKNAVFSIRKQIMHPFFPMFYIQSKCIFFMSNDTLHCQYENLIFF